MTALAAMARAGKVASSDIAGPRGEVRSGPDRVGRLLLGRAGRGSGRRRAALPGLRVRRRIGVLGVVKPRIAETIAADTGRRCLALRHACKAAARHMPRDIRAAKFGGACIRRDHCTKRDRCEQCRGERRCRFQNFHHVLLFFLVSAVAPSRGGIAGLLRCSDQSSINHF
jgi:hypothetical protein